MPYSSVSEVPSYVPEGKRKQWLHVFNSAYARAKAKGMDGKAAEAFAFRNANGVVKKSISAGPIAKFLSVCDKLLSGGSDEFDLNDDDLSLSEPGEGYKHEAIIKSVDKREWIVYGVVMEPTAEGELVDGKFSGTIHDTDTQGEFTTEPEIRKAMISFMEDLAKGQIEVVHNLQHSKIELDTAIIENWQVPEDFTLNGEVIRKGSWMQGTKVYNKEMRKAIDEGVITGYSIEGFGQKSVVD